MGYEMISGFILKGDAGGVQARRIIASLLESLPFAGKMMSTALTGTDDNWQIVYIQHVATGTIFLIIGIYDHVKTIWPRHRTFVVVFTLLLIMSLIFRAPLGQVESSQIKGPWFFIGIQELLHLTTHPGYLISFFVLLFWLFFFLPRMSQKPRSILKRVLLATSIFYLTITSFALLGRGENWRLQSWGDFLKSSDQLLIFDPVNTIIPANLPGVPENQKMEGCLVCHSSMTGLSESHKPSIIGCAACHMGDPFAMDKGVAHRTMVKVPGNFSNAGRTCGTQNCHPEITERIQSSLMTTQNGIIAIDKYLFKESKSLNDTFHVKNLGNTAADTHIRNLCGGCHLGKEKLTTGNAAWLDRGGGCNACHLLYNDQALISMKRMRSNVQVLKDEVHPTIDIQVSNERCRSCHSRSGRISLSYEGWNETTLTAKEVTDSMCQKVLPDDRVVEYIQADIHQQRGMSCIDCHGSYELMGDGNHPIHKEEGVNIQCIDCHPAGKPNTVVVGELPDRESQMIAWLRKNDPKSRVIITAKGRYPLINTKVDSFGNILLTDKLSGKMHLSGPLSAACTKGKGHDRLSCGSCHTSWVPQCIGCHNGFEKDTKGYDLLTNKPTSGTWVEYAGKNFARPPVLGGE